MSKLIIQGSAKLSGEIKAKLRLTTFTKLTGAMRILTDD